eukprot:366355-Chlamydomonas_euryale.AAC.2
MGFDVLISRKTTHVDVVILPNAVGFDTVILPLFEQICFTPACLAAPPCKPWACACRGAPEPLGMCLSGCPRAPGHVPVGVPQSPWACACRGAPGHVPVGVPQSWESRSGASGQPA